MHGFMYGITIDSDECLCFVCLISITQIAEFRPRWPVVNKRAPNQSAFKLIFQALKFCIYEEEKDWSHSSPNTQSPRNLLTLSTAASTVTSFTMSLIDTKELSVLQADAEAHLEWATVRLWECLLREKFFARLPWVMSSQQPPTKAHDDRRRIDILVEMFNESGKITTLLVIEAKQARAPIKDIDSVEQQAYNAALAYSSSLRSPRPVWAMTVTGTLARIWIYEVDCHYLTAFYPTGDGLSDVTEYCDITTHGLEFQTKMEYIKANPEPPADALDHASPSASQDVPLITAQQNPNPRRDLLAGAKWSRNMPALAFGKWEEIVLLDYSVLHPDKFMARIKGSGQQIALDQALWTRHTKEMDHQTRDLVVKSTSTSVYYIVL
ncbi:hypothetical protein BD289DRAFT_447824 [Coniella lustricola]|uniref:Uncharacterized protein n=1 Tax=Coniella lustricola TaxID=2025994 RepID=A0A2T2ZSQ3_9PEZI|nr:hypothetical protein BD289DRAFT_447824 [Coniella lustricola]